MTDAELDPDYIELLGIVVSMQNQITDAKAIMDEAKDKLRKLPPADYSVAGRPLLRITPTRRFDPERAVLLVPADLRPLCYQMTLDPAMVKGFLPPAVVDTCMVETGNPTVRLL